MIHEITIPINSEIEELGVNTIKIGISDVSKRTYCIIEGVPHVRVFTYFKDYYELHIGIFRVLNKRATCPFHTLCRVTVYVEDNYRLFYNAIGKLRGFINGV